VSHMKKVVRARAYVGVAMLLLSTLQALLWIVPKPATGLFSLAYVLPAAILLLLTYRLADPRFPEPRRRIPAFVVLLLMAAISFVGSLVIFEEAQGLPSWMSFGWQLAYIIWLPGIVLGMIVRRALRKRLPTAIRKDTIAEDREREVVHEQRLQRQLNARSAPSAPGRMTGLEPIHIVAAPLPAVPFLFGSPGADLHGAHVTADTAAEGNGGELNFARAMAQTGMLARFATFWSVHMPDEKSNTRQSTRADIDCVVVTGRSIILLDVKNYEQGDVTWLINHGELHLIDNPTGGYVGGPRRMSRNIEFARTRMRANFDGLGLPHVVDTRVVMMPTDNGMGRIDGLRWTGDIPVEALDETLALLSQEPNFDPSDKASEYIVRVLRGLVKDYSRSVPLNAERGSTQQRLVSPQPGTETAHQPPPEAPAAGSALPPYPR
jgi:hypothetical protein